jgi:hypothetical protein
MDMDMATSWLKKKKTAGLALHLLTSLLGFISGLVVLFLTFWFTYAIIWFGWSGVSAVSELIFSKRLYLSHGWRLAASGIFIVLLFIQHFRTSRWYWGTYPKDDYVSMPGLQARAGVTGSLVTLLAYPEASANMIADILLTGPRLVMGSFQLATQGLRWKKIDEHGCAQLLVILYERVVSVPYEELKDAGWDAWIGQLRCIDGVQFLQKGLVMTEELRKEFNGLQKK